MAGGQLARVERDRPKLALRDPDLHATADEARIERVVVAVDVDVGLGRNAQHQAAVATIVTASRAPVRLNDLTAEYEALGTELKRGGPDESWWSGFRREFGSIVEVHSANRPAMNADARYNRALQRLSTGDVDQALARAPDDIKVVIDFARP